MLEAYFLVVTVTAGFVVSVVVPLMWLVLGNPREDIGRWYWSLRFFWTFGTRPSKDPLEMKILQVVVNRTLSRLETSFSGWCNKENEMGAKYEAPTSNLEPDEPAKDLSELYRIRKKLARAKRKRNSARKTAEEFGFAAQQKEVER